MVGAQDGGMERQRNLILPERPQRGYWQFLYKYVRTILLSHGWYHKKKPVNLILKVRKCEIFDRFDFNYFILTP
jgi:hypothetical protein